MEVIKTDIEGVLIIEPRLFRDARGYFFESFSEREFKEKVEPLVGYNQAEVLARELGRVLNAEVRTDILVRSRRTQTQTKLDVAAKSQNVGNAFSVRVNAIVTNKLRHILIVDDVFTTGATMSACMDVLQKVCGPETRLSAATLGYVSNY